MAVGDAVVFGVTVGATDGAWDATGVRSRHPLPCPHADRRIALPSMTRNKRRMEWSSFRRIDTGASATRGSRLPLDLAILGLYRARRQAFLRGNGVPGPEPRATSNAGVSTDAR